MDKNILKQKTRLRKKIKIRSKISGTPERPRCSVFKSLNHVNVQLIDDLAQKRIDTPQKMVVWKCGSSCAGHDPAGVSKWISDVSIYYNKINNISS